VNYLKTHTLSLAFGASVLVHAVLLAIHFVAPPPSALRPTDPTLEVVLVNAKHDRAPLKAEALAQANLDGGGDADSGRAKSPLPDMRKTEDGDSIRAARQRIADLEEVQKNLLAQMKETPVRTTPATDKRKLDPRTQQTDGNESYDSQQAIARQAAEIARTISDQNKRPRKTYISPSTKAVGYAMYYNALQKHIEEIGTRKFPHQGEQKLYGEMTVNIPIFQDGSIYMREGGPRIEISSGNPALDRAALDIVHKAAPFGRFPENMRSSGKSDVWIIITRFKFTREQGMQTELRGGNNP
jgi:protein TonB